MKNRVDKYLIMAMAVCLILTFPVLVYAEEDTDSKVSSLKHVLTETIEYAKDGNQAKVITEFSEFEEGYESIEKIAQTKDKGAHEEIEEKISEIKNVLTKQSIDPEVIEQNVETIEHELDEIFGSGINETSNGVQKNIGVVLASMKELINEAKEKIEKQEFTAAKADISEAYEKYEGIESIAKARDLETHEVIEEKVQNLKKLLSADDPGNKAIKENFAELDRALIKLEKLKTGEVRATSWDGLIDSVTILLREGFEALLVFAALLAFLKKSGHANKTKYLYMGGFAGVVASIITAVVIASIFNSNVANREVLEGIVSLIATAMLFYVSYWLISKSNAQEWQKYIKGQTSISLQKNSIISLAFIAFLAVYREGFETALFYNALLPQVGIGKVLLGIIIGSLFLIGLAVALFVFGMRVPVKPFFTVTGILLYYLAFKFAGVGIHELQEGRIISETVVSYLPQINWLGIYPSIEVAITQGLLLAAAALSLALIYMNSKKSALKKEKLSDSYH